MVSTHKLLYDSKMLSHAFRSRIACCLLLQGMLVLGCAESTDCELARTCPVQTEPEGSANPVVDPGETAGSTTTVTPAPIPTQISEEGVVPDGVVGADAGPDGVAGPDASSAGSGVNSPASDDAGLAPKLLRLMVVVVTEFSTLAKNVTRATR